MRVATGWSTLRDSSAAAQEAYLGMASQLGAAPSWMLVSFSADYQAEAVQAALRGLAPGAQLQGATGCLGAMTERGFHSKDGHGLALVGLAGAGVFGVGAAPRAGDPKRAAGEAVRRALAAAGRPGEMPDLVWIASAPGGEEEVLLGIEAVVGRVPIAGGSTADNDADGDWRQLANDSVYDDAVAVTVMFPSARLGYAFLSGYSPTEQTGRVTRVEGRRLYEIDDLPAAEIYDRWTEGSIRELLRTDTNIIDRTTMAPLGRIVGSAGGLPYYRLTHLRSVMSDGSLSLFTAMEQGERVTLMQGSIESLVTRAGRVAAAALSTGSLRAEEASGALVIYCAGCMMAVRERMSDVVLSLNEVLKGKPFLGMFTFGEQGCFIGGENRHGNLMMSVVVFGR